MKRSLLYTCILSAALTTGHAQSFRQVFPLPQSIRMQQGTVAIPQSPAYSYAPTLAGSYPLNLLTGWMGNSNAKSKMRVVLGLRGDRTVKKYTKKIPPKAESYYISVEEQQIVLAANDLRGLFYAVQTLQQSAADGHLPLGEVTDYPDVRYRGVVEGFYGTPWTFRARMSQLEFYGKHKLNVYIYGPKDDPYHSVPNWRKPYPAEEASHIRALVQQADNNGVIFYWAIHPGQDIQWNDADRDKLIAKFNRMYDLGVRAFAVFFDDISGEGTKAEKQAELLNYIDNHFVKAKADVAPLVMCPTEYNRAWSDVEGGYLPTLGNRLNKDIEIMWTGNSVVACIDKPDVEWINGHLKRNAYIWWNFPVSDFVRDHLLLGPVYGNSTAIAPLVSGFLSNPMEHAEASKIALSSIADYTWNMARYDTDASYRNALTSVAPKDARELGIFAQHCSDLGPNGHRFRREESELIAPLLDALTATTTPTAAQLTQLDNECRTLEEATDCLLGSGDNIALADEMRPWLDMGKLLAEYGRQVVRLCQTQNAADTTAFERSYKRARALQMQMYNIDSQENQNPYQPGVKVGSRRLLPAINHLFVAAVTAYNQAHSCLLSTATAYVPFTFKSTVPQLAGLSTSTRGKNMHINSSNEVIKWGKGQSLTLQPAHAMTPGTLTIDLGTPQVAHQFMLEAFADGAWHPVALQQEQNTIRATVWPQGDVSAIRLTQQGADELKVYFRTFSLNQK